MNAYWFRYVYALAILLAGSALAQSPDITSFQGNGVLTWTNSDTNLYYRIEWTPSLTAPTTWYSDFSSLMNIRSSGSIVTSSVPMFFRVYGGDNRITSASPTLETGQTNSYAPYDDQWYSSDIAWPSPRFTLGTGTSSNCVTDNMTGLMWLRNPDAATRTWVNAITYCEALDGNAGRGNYSDWRMPNLRELLSIVNFGAFNPALPVDHPFRSVQHNYYWVSSTVIQYPTYAWSVHLGNGTVYSALKTTPPLYTLPVRGGL